MASVDHSKDGGGGSEDELLVNEEEGEEATMDIEEIEKEPKDSVKVKRCSACRRMVFGHKGTVGKEKCKLKKIEEDDELKKNDQIKNEMRKKKREIMNKA